MTLAALLSARRPTTVWADAPGAGAARYGATVISAYGGRMPRGGTLILLGTHVQPGTWLDYAKPRRLIVLCVLSYPQQVYAALTQLERPGLPPAELVFVSSRLQATLGLPGRIGPEPLDLERFRPRPRSPRSPRATGLAFTIGRHSRDVPEKHHPADPSLYRMAAWSGVHTRLLGGTCLAAALGGQPEIEIFAAGSLPAEDFLAGLDCFFYRTHPSWSEPSGRVVMEALASGLPVIAHDSGGYTDWLTPGENGYVFSTQEEAYDLIQLLRRQPEQRLRMAQAARATAEREAGGERLRDYLDWLSA
ncbi:MAG TPA: glycosyltransferase [Azospira sp.]|nr:glycosyltransferase [Azospira sp.]